MPSVTYRSNRSGTALRHQEGFGQAANEVVVVGLAVGADDHVRVLGVEVEAGGDVDDSATAALARQAFLAAGCGRKDVVGVHGPDHQVAAVPVPLACHALDVVAAFQARQAGSVQELQAPIPNHLQKKQKTSYFNKEVYFLF